MRTKDEILKSIDRLKEWIESADKELEIRKNPFDIECLCAAKYDWKRQIDRLTKELELCPQEFSAKTQPMSEEKVQQLIKSIRETPIQIVPSQSNPIEIIKEHVAAINEQIRLISEDKNFNATIEASIKEKEAYDNSLIIPRYVKFPYLEIKITETI